MRALLMMAIVSMTGPAWAEIDADAKRMLADQVKAIGAGDAHAFAAAFGGDSFAFLPTASGEGLGKPAIEAAAKAWLAGLGKVTVTADAARCGTIYMGAGAWCSATLTATAGKTTKQWRALLVVEDVVADNGSRTQRILAEHLSEPVDDKTALAAAAAGKLPALHKLPPTPAAGKSVVDPELAADRIARRAGQVEDSPAVVLIGSAPGELAVGKAAVAARLKAWRSLQMATTDVLSGRGANSDMYQIYYVAAHVDATFTISGKPVKVPYRALVVYFDGPAAAEQPTKLECAHFSVATQ